MHAEIATGISRIVMHTSATAITKFVFSPLRSLIAVLPQLRPVPSPSLPDSLIIVGAAGLLNVSCGVVGAAGLLNVPCGVKNSVSDVDDAVLNNLLTGAEFHSVFFFSQYLIQVCCL